VAAMPTTIPPTTTGRPARVRFEPEQATRYARMLRDERHDLVRQRAYAKDEGKGIEVSSLNREIEAVSRMQEELARACEERGWDLD